MNHEEDPTAFQAEPFTTLSTYTETIPEISETISLITANPEISYEVLSRYKELLNGMANFQATEIAIAQRIREALLPNKEDYSASTARLIDVYRQLGEEYSPFLASLFDAAMDLTIGTTVAGMKDYVDRLEGGHKLSSGGHDIKDGDEASDRVIWGHTLIKKPRAMMHFLAIHYLERVACAMMLARGFELGNEKDFFLNGMIDAILIDGHHDYEDLFKILSLDRESGGVGWKIKLIEEQANL